MTIVDWMMAHPWMTFFICLAFATAISDLGKIGRKEPQRNDSDDR